MPAPATSSTPIVAIVSSCSAKSSVTKGSLRSRVSSIRREPPSTQKTMKPSTSALWMFQASCSWLAADTSEMPAPVASHAWDMPDMTVRAKGSSKK
jgi:hypothetical protein